MALNISPVHRNLHTRVTFLHLEFEDWFVDIGHRGSDQHLRALACTETSSESRMNVFLQYIVPVLSDPVVDAFKYGKPRRYLMDFGEWHTKPRIYCGMEPDSQIRTRLPEGGGPECPRLCEQHERTCTSRPCASCCRSGTYLDDVIVRTTGAFVAGYDLGGINSYYHTDERPKPDEVVAGGPYPFAARAIDANAGAVRGSGRRRRSPGCTRTNFGSDNRVVQSLDRLRLDAWRERETVGLLSPSASARVFLLGPADPS